MNPRMLNYWYMPSSGQHFPEELKSLFSVLWLGQVSGNTLVDESGNGNDINITDKDFATNYIPPTSTATFSLDNVAALKTDDNFDGCWYTDAGAVKQVPVTYFINNDYSRTLVKYSNESPYNVEWIALLDDAATPTTEEWQQLHSLFKLHVFWSGVFNDYGIVKDNRALEAQGYKGWIEYINTLGLTHPTETVKASINKFCIDLHIYGVDSGFDRLWISMLNDADLISGVGTVSIYNPTSIRKTFPSAPTYTTSGYKGNGSSQYANTKFKPATHGVKYTKDNASYGFFMYSVSAQNTAYVIGTLLFQNTYWTGGLNGSAARRINSTGNASTLTSNSIEYYAMDRSSSTSISSYSGISKSNSTVTSGDLPTDEMLSLRSQFGYGDQGIAMDYYGRSFSQTEHANIRTAFLAHKTRLGL